jgi:D-amino peptidase
MRVFISVDMEGISGIVAREQVIPGERDFQIGRELMTKEANAAIEGAVAAGAKEILVRDSHANKINLLVEQLHEAADFISGSPTPMSMVEGLEQGADAVLLVGYHSREGSLGGVLDHTMSGKSVAAVLVNGQEFGETALSAMVAGELSIPTVFLSGDRAACDQAQKLITGIATVAVKEGLGRYAARCMAPRRARGLIKEKVERSLKSSKAKPFVVKAPLDMVIEFKDSGKADAAARIPHTRRVDGHRVGYDAKSCIDAYKAAVAMITMAQGAP